MELKVQLIPDGVDEDGNDILVPIEEAITRAIEPTITRLIERRVEKIAVDAIKETASAVARERMTAMLEKPVPITNSYGEMKGETRTLTEIMVAAAQETMHSRGNYGSTTLLQEAVNKACNEIVKAEMLTQVESIRAQMANEIATRLTGIKKP